MRSLLTSAVLVSGLLVAPFASAHGDTSSLEAEVGPYFIDIGYDTLAPDNSTEFDLDLFHKDTLDFADFAKVNVRVSRAGAEMFQETSENDRVNIPMVMVYFPEAGDYDMDVRYLDAQDKLIAAHTFRLQVPGAAVSTMRKAEDTLHYVLAAGLFALSAGIAGYALWQRYGKKR